MSRIGNKKVTLPAGVSFTNNNNYVTVKGPKGELSAQFDTNMVFEVEGNVVTIKRPDDSKEMKTIHGTTRANFNNMVVGVSEGFKKQLDIIGVGYRAQLSGNKLTVSAGYSHDVIFEVPADLKLEVVKGTTIIITGNDIQSVGSFAAKIRAVRKPEPYHGKGIRYTDEHVRRKEGKTAKK